MFAVAVQIIAMKSSQKVSHYVQAYPNSNKQKNGKKYRTLRNMVLKLFYRVLNKVSHS